MSDNESVMYDSDDARSVNRDFERQRNEDRDNLYHLREMHATSLQRFFREIDDVEVMHTLSVAELEMRIERMRTHFEGMENAHRLYRQVCLLATDDIYEDIEAQFVRQMAKAKDRISELQGIGQHSFDRTDVAANSTMHPLMQPIIRVEPFREPRIGQFDGDAAAWPASRDLFIAEVHNKDFDPVSKLLYLKDACVGRAADTLGPWEHTADNYDLAWNTMMESYNDNYNVIQGIIGKYHAIPKQERDDHDSLARIGDMLKGCLRQMNTMTDIRTAFGQMWIHMTRLRMPNKALDAWEQYRNGLNRLPTADELQRFLDTRAKGRRELEHNDSTTKPSKMGGKAKHEASAVRPKPYDQNRTHTGDRSFRPVVDSSRYQGGPTRCIMSGCDRTHYLGQCDAFRRLTREQRLETARRHRLCMNCLLPGHMANACLRGQCRDCPESATKHHFRLCPKPPVAANVGQSTKPNPRE